MRFSVRHQLDMHGDVDARELTFPTMSSSGSGVLGDTTVLDGAMVLSDCWVGEAYVDLLPSKF